MRVRETIFPSLFQRDNRRMRRTSLKLEEAFAQKDHNSCCFVGCLAAIAQTPERKVVNNNIIISDHDPK